MMSTFGYGCEFINSSWFPCMYMHNDRGHSKTEIRSEKFLDTSRNKKKIELYLIYTLTF